MHNLMSLIDTFGLNSLKIQTYLMLMKLRRQDPDFKAKSSGLSEISLFILGLCYLHCEPSNDARDHNVIEYTVIQENLLSSSNNIRKELYYLEENGFIAYFARGKKEFIRVITGYKYKKQDLNHERLISNSQDTSFQCKNCLSHFGYLEAWRDDGFYCPNCQSTNIGAG